MNDDLDSFFNDEIFQQFLKKYNSRKKKYYWNNSIQSKDKNNNINYQRRKFNPSLVVKNSKKRIGINKLRSRFGSDCDFNELNN